MNTTDLLAALISDGPLPEIWWADIPSTQFWAAADRHGVTPLAAAALLASHDVPLSWRDEATGYAGYHVAVDLAREAALRRLLLCFRDLGVRALLIKGELLAHTFYQRPDLRPRLDTDILIPADHRQRAHQALLSLGYQPDVQASGDRVLHQCAYASRLGVDVFHVVDVHWRLYNPEVFRHVLSFEEMAQAALPIPPLGDGGAGLSAVHALLVACVHRVAHHFDNERLIWLYDIHLIASRFEDDDWEAFLRLAADRRVGAICRRGLARSSERFRTRVPVNAVSGSGRSSRQPSEVTAAYMVPNRPHVHAVVDDLRALQTWTERWQLIREYAFPPVRYMRHVYAPSSAMPLFWLYARRMLSGARKWL